MIVVAQVRNHGARTALSAVGGQRELGPGRIWNRWSAREKSIMSSVPGFGPEKLGERYRPHSKWGGPWEKPVW